MFVVFLTELELFYFEAIFLSIFDIDVEYNWWRLSCKTDCVHSGALFRSSERCKLLVSSVDEKQWEQAKILMAETYLDFDLKSIHIVCVSVYRNRWWYRSKLRLPLVDEWQDIIIVSKIALLLFCIWTKLATFICWHLIICYRNCVTTAWAKIFKNSSSIHFGAVTNRSRPASAWLNCTKLVEDAP